MTARRRTTWVIIGLVGFAAVAGGFVLSRGRGGKAPVGSAQSANKVIGPDATLSELAEALKRSGMAALGALAQRLEARPDGPAKGLDDAEGADWAEVVAGLRAGYLKFAASNGRAGVVSAVAPILAKFAVEPAPPSWLGTLLPSFDLLNSGLNDPSPDVRAAALGTIAKLWSWLPGRPMTRAEEGQLDEWKDRFHQPVVRRLGDQNPRVIAAAVACLGMVPIDSLAAPALAYLDYGKGGEAHKESGEVRHQVLVSFGSRPALLTEDMILKRLHDEEPGVPQLAELILKTRGLSRDQIALGKLVTSPRPEMRASVVSLVKDRDDLDPVVWLLKLSHDEDETVRTKAVEAMAGKDSPDLRARLREMAAQDTSPAVRAAVKLVAPAGGPDSTVALPPLPGLPSLTPKAN